MGKLIKFISKEEFEKILKAEQDKRYKLAYVLAFGSGLRISEILGPHKNSNQEIKPLQQSQINLQTRQIKVLGKGGKERITITSPWINETNIKLLPLQLSRTTLQNRFRRLCIKTLNKDLNFHTLRHGFANWLINDLEIPLPMVQGFGGWSRLDTVGIYAKANPSKAVNKVWENF